MRLFCVTCVSVEFWGRLKTIPASFIITHCFPLLKLDGVALNRLQNARKHRCAIPETNVIVGSKEVRDSVVFCYFVKSQ